MAKSSKATARRSAARAPKAPAAAGAPAPERTTAAAAKASTVATDRESDVRDQNDELKGSRRDDHGRLLFWARRPFGYDGSDLDRGQVLALSGQVNDTKLNRLGYVVPLLPSDKLFPCRYCRSQFVDLNTLNAHGAKRHSERDARPQLPSSDRGLTVDDTAAEADALEREQERLERDAPLNLDKAASARA